MKERRVQLIIALCLIIMGVSLRLLPHPANFAPVTAIAIFGGAVLPRKLALWVPLLAMIVSDAVIGFYSTMYITWGCFALIALASSLWLKKPTLIKGGIVTLCSSLFFYVATNFAVWVSSGMYPHTWSGLVNCYVMAVPFFRNTLLSDVIYTSLLFGVYALAISRVKVFLRASTSSVN
jgi:hypothetical protein